MRQRRRLICAGYREVQSGEGGEHLTTVVPNTSSSSLVTNKSLSKDGHWLADGGRLYGLIVSSG